MDLQGRSLRGVLAGKTPGDWRSSVYYRYWMHGAHFNVAAHYGIRTKRHKLIFYYGLPLGKRGCTKNPHKPEWELFDLQNDPREMKNVYADRAYAGAVRELKAELLRLKRQLGDEDEAYPALMKVRQDVW